MSTDRTFSQHIITKASRKFIEWILSRGRRIFTNKNWGLQHMGYRVQFVHLTLYSWQRSERYLVIYVWKTIKELVPKRGV
ncbi:hypothetical protein E2C01_051051 [Portunus trituberculatus]|uniref:Uncharacterized protein n=1 Tax=Portunus trituberculatus TaxID=210409 RepID=A0A5B7GHP7_PORTR|nr:hypothetical protein [Portunus trituberculatus]